MLFEKIVNNCYKDSIINSLIIPHKHKSVYSFFQTHWFLWCSNWPFANIAGFCLEHDLHYTWKLSREWKSNCNFLCNTLCPTTSIVVDNQICPWDSRPFPVQNSMLLCTLGSDLCSKYSQDSHEENCSTWHIKHNSTGCNEFRFGFWN